MSVEPLKESHQNLSFQKSKNPKIPTQVSDFWKLEEFAQNPKNPKFLEFPKIHPKPSFGFLETRGILAQNPNPKFLEFPKIRNWAWFGFLDFWKLEEFWVFLDFEQIPRVSKNLGLGFLDFWKLEEFWVFLDFEQIPSFQKSETWVGIFGFLDFGNSRNFGFFGF